MSNNIPKKSGWGRFIKNKYFIIGVVVVVILAIYFVMRGGSSSTIESAVVVSGNVIEKVSVTGKISPLEKADLSFDSSGSISNIYVKVGDKVNKGQLLASLDNADAVASLASAQAKLDDLTRALRPEELLLEKAKVDSALVALSNAKTNAINAVRDGYVETQGAIFNYTDTFFRNPQSGNPTIIINAQSNAAQSSINFERVAVSDYLKYWKSDLDNATSTDGVDVLLINSNKYISETKSFADHLSVIVNSLSVSGSALSQSVIDSYVSTMNLGQSSLNQAVTSIATAKTALEQSQTAYNEVYNNFVLKNAGSSAEAIRAQQATVNSLAATVAKGRIYSPIEGTVTRVDPHEGEYASPGQAGFAVQSEGSYKIEAYVPEADIAKIIIGNQAEVTLDAYGSDTIFGAVVTLIDPAETVLEGVPTYKVTLQFGKEDVRIRSGMTANTDIMTREHDNVLYVPTRAIITDDSGAKSVRVLNKDGKTFASIPVTLGLKGSSGTTEIVSGLSAGQKVVTYSK